MTIAKVEYVCSYDSIWDFVEEYLKEVKELFKEELKDLKIEKDETEKEAVARHLIEKGICDEDVIRAVLDKKKKNYFVKYVDDSNCGYFEIYEVEG